jgi:FkbM family methyltransferase
VTQKGRFSSVEVVAFAILTALLAVVVYHSRQQTRRQQQDFYSAAAIAELDLLKPYAGMAHSSRNFEEFIIRDAFQDRRGGVFLDVGASHHQRDSNTYYLETALGWSGIAVDALQEFAAGYQAHRPRTRFVAMFASDVTDSSVPLFVPNNDQVSSVDPAFAKQGGGTPTARLVPTTTLNAVLDAASVPSIDFLSMDIELAEPKALAGFDIDRFQPELVCIEAHWQVRQAILDYFADHGYVVVGKYLRIDPYNLYFKPKTR